MKFQEDPQGESHRIWNHEIDFQRATGVGIQEYQDKEAQELFFLLDGARGYPQLAAGPDFRRRISSR